MKIALFALLGLLLGAVGGAALGIGAGLAWVEIFKTSDFEGYSGMLVFFTFMPAGAMIGGLGGAALFWHSGGPRRRNRGGIRITDASSGQVPEIGRICAMQNCICISANFDYFNPQISVQRSRHGVANDAHQGRSLTSKFNSGNKFNDRA